MKGFVCLQKICLTNFSRKLITCCKHIYGGPCLLAKNLSRKFVSQINYILQWRFYLSIHFYLSMQELMDKKWKCFRFLDIYKKVTHLDLLVDKYLYVLKYSLDKV
jgi:hypothetical protein